MTDLSNQELADLIGVHLHRFGGRVLLLTASVEESPAAVLARVAKVEAAFSEFQQQVALLRARMGPDVQPYPPPSRTLGSETNYR